MEWKLVEGREEGKRKGDDKVTIGSKAGGRRGNGV